MTNEQRHDAIYNEGGEGFNPYRDKIEPPTEGPPTRSERKSEIYRRLEVINGTFSRERNADEIAELREELDLIEASELAEFCATWTRETTKARREAWNAKVDAGQIKTAADVDAFRRANGWGLSEIREAVKLYKNAA